MSEGHQYRMKAASFPARGAAGSRTLRDRAEECRVLAESFRPEARQKLLKLAAEYDHLAMKAAAWELSDLEKSADAK